MTTVVYRDGILAGDSRVTGEGSTIYPVIDKKVFKSKHGWLYAAAGIIAECEDFYDWAARVRANPKIGPAGEYEGILISPKGIIRLVDGGRAWKLDAPFVAIGSGTDAALGALHMGATAVEAVEVAAKVDNKTALPVSIVSILKP